MKTLEKAEDKINKICAVLRAETLEPAQGEAQKIVENAQRQAERIIADAHKSAEKIHTEAKIAIEQEYNVLQSSLQQAVRQALETLRQTIERKFFSDYLPVLIEKEGSDPKLIAGLINAIVKALEKEGMAANLTAIVAKHVVPREVNELLLQEVVKALDHHTVAIGHFNAGVELKLNNRNMTIDVSEDALKELLATHVARKDFREMVFKIT